MKNQHGNKIAFFQKKLNFFGLILFLMAFAPNSFSQSSTEINLPKHRYFEDHNPTKAMWMSAALPGLGQYYNKKYWKIPIVYTGFSTLAYFSIINKQEYVKYRDAYSLKLELNGTVANIPLIDNYTKEQLLSMREYYQSNLELNYILFGAFYLLQIIDAAVDAHLYQYDINDNLSFGIDPIIYQNNSSFQVSPAFKLRYTFGNP
ncbi:MAG TPA: hypothetical protein DCG69_07900 [Bacteroidales bacterium]|nr:hypothetical protein [Bacteroidales bacterium]